MNTITTEGIKISVKPSFNRGFSNIHENQFIFNYDITIENEGNHDVQLLDREWYIFDSLNKVETVKGPGVIGKHPILTPGDQFSYQSGCQLVSEIGYMKGSYGFINILTGKKFRVEIPQFDLVAPSKLN